MKARSMMVGEILPDLVAEYSGDRPESHKLFERACRVFPGGGTRSITHFDPFPTAIAEGHGAHLTDVDGHVYLDLVNNYTSLVHGNAFPPLVEAIAQAAANGTVFAAMHPAQLALGEALIRRVPGAERVRLTNSGSEASALALRIARAATARRTVVVVEGAYHGAVPPFTADEPEVRRLPFGDVEAVASIVTDDVAAVFAEPFLGSGGVIELPADYLHTIREQARRVGALFVLDEVQSLRNAPHGMGAALGLDPDLITFAKIIGGGLAIGAVGGRRELLELTSPLRPDRIEHAGTFNGHVAAASAGVVSLQHLPSATIESLNARAARLAERLRASSTAAGFPVEVTRSGSILNVHPGTGEVRHPSDAQRNLSARAALHLALLLEGVYATPRGMINLSTVLEEDELDLAVRGYAGAFERLAPHAEQLLEASR